MRAAGGAPAFLHTPSPVLAPRRAPDPGPPPVRHPVRACPGKTVQTNVPDPPKPQERQGSDTGTRNGWREGIKRTRAEAGAPGERLATPEAQSCRDRAPVRQASSKRLLSMGTAAPPPRSSLRSWDVITRWRTRPSSDSSKSCAAATGTNIQISANQASKGQDGCAVESYGWETKSGPAAPGFSP